MAGTERMLTVAWEDPLAQAEAGAALSGLERLRGIIAGTIPPPPIARLMGFDFAEVGDGRAVFTLVPGEQHYNAIGVVHGGVVATLLDSALGCAIHTKCAAGQGYTTLEVKVNFVRPVTLETGRVRAEGSVLHFGRSTATADGRLVDASGKLYAHATTTCLVFERRA